jgi:4-amino-4-deoxy-L-arabinose transferase-like glycosyltransferase
LPASRLLCAWILPFWVLLELTPTKLPHYVLPLYPALALAVARAAVALGEEGMAQPLPALRIGFPIVWAIAGVALGALALAAPPLLHLDAMAAGGVAAAGAVAAAWQVLVRDRCRLGTGSALIAIVGSLLVLMPSFALVAPALDPIWLSRSAGTLVESKRHPGEVVAVVGYAEPSLVFLLGTETRLEAAEPAAQDLAAGKAALALVAEVDAERFRTALAADGGAASSLGEVSGLNYSNGKWMKLALYRLDPK